MHEVKYTTAIRHVVYPVGKDGFVQTERINKTKAGAQ